MANRYASLNELKDRLGVPRSETTIDAPLTQELEAASEDLEDYIGYTLARTSYSNEAHVGGSDTVVANAFPIDKTQTLQVKSFDGCNLQILDPSLYTVEYERGIVRLYSGFKFPICPSGAQLTYTAGYASVGSGDDQKFDAGPSTTRSITMLAAARYRAGKGMISADALDSIESDVYQIWDALRGGL